MALSIASPCSQLEVIFFATLAQDEGDNSPLNFVSFRLFRSCHHDVLPVPGPGIQVTGVEHTPLCVSISSKAHIIL